MFRSNKRKLMQSRSDKISGSVMPLIAISSFLLLGVVGICTDLMRDFETVQQLEFAAQSAALYGLSLATNSDGSYTVTSAQNNITTGINTAASLAWNSAQSGPQNQVWSQPITFAGSDIKFVSNPNPNDASEFFVDLTAKRNGSDALIHFFLPALYTALPLTRSPNPLSTFSTSQTVEVLGQPSSRIGAAVPAAQQTGQRSLQLTGFAAMPLAISNQQFSGIALNSASVGSTYTVDFISSQSAEYTGAAPAGHIKGCFVNVAPGANGSFYGTAISDSDISQFEGLLNYFGAASHQQTVPPNMVERGSQLNAFDPASASFIARQSDISQTLSQLPLQKFYIIPVLLNDPTFSGGNGTAITGNVVAGFAWLRLVSISPSTLTATFQVGQSIPVRNATAATGFTTAGFSAGNLNLLPPPVSPFTPRTVDPSSGGMSVRPAGVVLAPAISPRQLYVPLVIN